MRAATIHRFGDTPQIEQLGAPEPATHEVRVRIHAASVNNIDLAIIAGDVQARTEHRFPLIPGQDYAGVVDAIGAGVTDFAIGDRVFGVAFRPYFGDGTYAEFATLSTERGIAHLPDEVSFIEGAALGVASATALQAITLAELEQGETVLVIGATGGVGNTAVQLAKRAGAQVIATAATAADHDLMTQLGADAVINYKDPEALSRHLAAEMPGGTDAVLHFAGDRTAAGAYARIGGRLVSAMSRGEFEDRADLINHNVYADMSTDKLTFLADLIARGELKVHVAQTFPLDQTAEALAAFSAGKTGKIILTVAS